MSSQMGWAHCDDISQPLPFHDPADSRNRLRYGRFEVSLRMPDEHSPHLLAGRAEIGHPPLRSVTAMAITYRRKLTAAIDITRPA